MWGPTLEHSQDHPEVELAQLTARYAITEAIRRRRVVEAKQALIAAEDRPGKYRRPRNERSCCENHRSIQNGDAALNE